MSKKKSRNQLTFIIDIDPRHPIVELTHAKIPERLYEVLFRTACDWATNGDSEAAQWVIDELIIFDRMDKRREYNVLRCNGKVDNLYGKPCVECGEPSDSIDHIIPLSRGGTNDISNLQPMCLKCNIKKGNRTS